MKSARLSVPMLSVSKTFAFAVGIWISGIVMTPSASAAPCCDTCESRYDACADMCDQDYGYDLDAWESCYVNECDPLFMSCWNWCIECDSHHYHQSGCCVCPGCGEFVCGTGSHYCNGSYRKVKEICKGAGSDVCICSSCGEIYFCGSWHVCNFFPQ